MKQWFWKVSQWCCSGNRCKWQKKRQTLTEALWVCFCACENSSQIYCLYFFLNLFPASPLCYFTLSLSYSVFFTCSSFCFLFFSFFHPLCLEFITFVWKHHDLKMYISFHIHMSLFLQKGIFLNIHAALFQRITVKTLIPMWRDVYSF